MNTGRTATGHLRSWLVPVVQISPHESTEMVGMVSRLRVLARIRPYRASRADLSDSSAIGSNAVIVSGESCSFADVDRETRRFLLIVMSARVASRFCSSDLSPAEMPPPSATIAAPRP